MNLTFTEKLTLGKGLKFAPTQTKTNENSLDTSILKFKNLCNSLLNNKDILTSKKSKLFLPYTGERNYNTSLSMNFNFFSSLIHERTQYANQQRFRHNLNYSEMKFLHKLTHESPNIIIKPADKNLGVTLLDKSWYVNEIERQLNDRETYQEINIQRIYGMTNTIIRYLTWTINIKLYQYDEELFMKRSIEILNKGIDWKSIPQIYILPKVHKQPLKGRPIIPSFNTLTTGISKYLDYILQPYVSHCFTVIKDSKSLVNLLEETTFPSECMLFTADISSLYTNIPTSKGIEYIEQFMFEMGLPPWKITEYRKLLEIVLNNNIFKFDNKLYLQINGTAMGTVVAPTYANIFMYILERDLIYQNRDKILYYGRYLDDIIMITKKLTNHSSTKLMNDFNKLDPHIEFNWTISETRCEFLDLVISKDKRFNQSNIFDISVHQKELNNYLYIPYNSFHPLHQKSAVIKTELIRYIRNTSSLEEYIRIKNKFFDRLRARGYPKSFLKRFFNIVRYKDRSTYLQTSSSKQKDLKPFLPFVIDYTSCNLFNKSSIETAIYTALKVFLLSKGIDYPIKIVFRSANKLSRKLCKNSVINYRRPQSPDV